MFQLDESPSRHSSSQQQHVPAAIKKPRLSSETPSAAVESFPKSNGGSGGGQGVVLPPPPPGALPLPPPPPHTTPEQYSVYLYNMAMATKNPAAAAWAASFAAAIKVPITVTDVKYFQAIFNDPFRLGGKDSRHPGSAQSVKRAQRSRIQRRPAADEQRRQQRTAAPSFSPIVGGRRRRTSIVPATPSSSRSVSGCQRDVLGRAPTPHQYQPKLLLGNQV